MTDRPCFISYSNADGLQSASQLANDLQGRHPNIKVWFDKNDLDAGEPWDTQIAEAIRDCKCLLFVMTDDSVTDNSVCKDEWTWALKYKKPIIPLHFHPKADLPFRLNNLQYIEFARDFAAGIAQLRERITNLDSPKGILDQLKHRLDDAKRDLKRASDLDKSRIQAEIEELTKQIETQKKIVDNPQVAAEQTQKNIETGLERERKPEKPVISNQSSKFINQPPGIAQTYFQDRFTETELVIHFLKDEAKRLLTVVGRGGAGKTAMVCRLLKFVENGGLPDDCGRVHGRVDVDGIVYLSEAGSRKVNFANLFEDLCKLLPAASAEKLSALYREPQTSTESKTVQLLAAFQGLKQVIVLLDNFENVVDAEKGQVRDAELDEALRAILHAPHHPVKVIITTRVSARELDTFEPARQRLLPLDTGLQPEYAREAFVLMDEGNLVGIKNAGADLLNLAVTRTLGLPRALEALYAALRTDRFTTLQELLDLPILPEQVVQAYVGEAFNRLDTNAQKVMQALAVYNRPVTPAAVDYLLAPHIPAIDSAPILQRLANMHFARKESGRFYLHPVDREFAYNLLPEGSPDDTFIEKGGLQLFGKLWDLLDKYPDLLQNQDTFNQAVKNENANIVIGSVMAFQNLDDSLVEKMQQEGIFQDEDFLAELDKSFHIPPIWSRYALNNRAADYFAQARKPRAEWKKLDDLSAQLAEFDLRCAAGDYDTAASVLLEFDGEYLLLWGHNRLVIQLHETVGGKINDKIITINSNGNLGTAYRSVGDARKAIQHYEVALKMSLDIKDRQSEETWLGNLGNAYGDLGEIKKAIEYYEQALTIDREIGDRRGEGDDLSNLGNRFVDLGDIEKAIEFYEQALIIHREIGNQQRESHDLSGISSCYEKSGQISKAIEFRKNALSLAQEIGDRNQEGVCLSVLGSYYKDLDNQKQAKGYFEQSLAIAQETGYRYGEGFRLLNLVGIEIEFKNYKRAIELALQSTKIGDEISRPHLQINSYADLALVYLLSENLETAQKSIEAALGYDVPANNHNASALHGIIALRQGDEVAARGAFVRAIGQADEILSKTAEYYEALDAKGLAICGLAICDLRLAGRGAVPAPNITAPNDAPANVTGREHVTGRGDPGQGNPAPTVEDAIETFKKARRIAPHAGVVKSVLRLFDELAKCDTAGILKEVRKAAEGS